MGSAAMNMCMVAHGYADGYYECGLHCWDIAAGHLIVREAGGFASSLNSKALFLEIVCVTSITLQTSAGNLTLWHETFWWRIPSNWHSKSHRLSNLYRMNVTEI